jgi:hypothetical protein
LPLPETRRVEDVLQSLAAECDLGKVLPSGLADLDRRLLAAAAEDNRLLLEAVLQRFGRYAPGRRAHDYRKRNMLTACGWIEVSRVYCRPLLHIPTLPHRKDRAPVPCVFPLDAALGLEQGATPAARDAVARCAALCGSLAEARGMLAHLTPIQIATATLRVMALRTGQKALDRQENPPSDIRPPQPPPAPGDTRRLFPVERTMYIMMDGTGVPCTETDTAHVKGRASDGKAGKREIKVGIIGYYAWLDPLERPVPEPASTTHVVTIAKAPDFGILLRKAAISRGYATAPRVQVVGDGADWIANIATQAFPRAIFTADFYHACEHLYALCLLLKFPDDQVQTKYRRLKGILFRHGAQSLIRHLNKVHAPTITASIAAQKELAYFQKRISSMRYGAFRKQGLYIASGHAEAACRTDVARRCKQAGMHWRHHNAVRISAILATLRSGTFAP